MGKDEKIVELFEEMANAIWWMNEGGKSRDRIDNVYEKLNDLKRIVIDAKSDKTTEKKWFNIHATAEIDVNEETFNKELEEWFESKGWGYHGVTKPTMDE